MEEKSKSVLKKFNKIEEELRDPNIINDVDQYKKIMKEHKHLMPVAEKAAEYLKVIDNLRQNKDLINDPEIDHDLKDMAYDELDELNEQKEKIEENLRLMLIPKDPNDEKNCIFEVRAGTGGDEAGLFAGDLYRMYQRYAEINGYKIDVISFNEGEMGGFKEIVFSMNGEEAYGRTKFESGVHRVQRVPETESSGRLHTSAATVAVLPEAEDVDVEINDEDLRIDIFRAGGKGGQNVNKVETAVRIVHNPSGIVVSCQEERSQLKNRQKAMKVLRTRLFEKKQQEMQDEISSTRKSMVKTGDRSEKIRTYNYPQNRVTDHRLEGDAKNYSLEDVMAGNLGQIIDNLRILERSELLKES